MIRSNGEADTCVEMTIGPGREADVCINLVCWSGELWVGEGMGSQRGAGAGTVQKCFKSVGGCGSGLVLNGQECWRGTGVVWVWVWV